MEQSCNKHIPRRQPTVSQETTVSAVPLCSAQGQYPPSTLDDQSLASVKRSGRPTVLFPTPYGPCSVCACRQQISTSIVHALQATSKWDVETTRESDLGVVGCLDFREMEDLEPDMTRERIKRRLSQYLSRRDRCRALWLRCAAKPACFCMQSRRKKGLGRASLSSTVPNASDAYSNASSLEDEFHKSAGGFYFDAQSPPSFASSPSYYSEPAEACVVCEGHCQEMNIDDGLSTEAALSSLSIDDKGREELYGHSLALNLNSIQGTDGALTDPNSASNFELQADKRISCASKYCCCSKIQRGNNIISEVSDSTFEIITSFL